jgi:Sec-independent protein translocase protein TatA
MSLFELLVVLIVGILVAKPEDLPKIAAKLKEIRAFITNTKKEITSQITSILDEDSDEKEKEQDFASEMEQMNFYLEKISSLGSDYQGEYSLSEIKSHYQKLVNDQIKFFTKKN